MPSLIRLMKFLGIALIAMTTAFVVGFIATSGSYSVPATVAVDPTLPRLEIAGTTLHVRTYGDPAQPVVIVVHGGPGGDHRSLLPLRALSDEYFVVFYDQRGSGLSARVQPEQLTVERSLADLEALSRHFAGSKPVRLVGHSWGGMLVAAFVAANPNRVAATVLIEPMALRADLAERAGVDYGFDAGMLTDLGFVRRAVRTWFESLHVDNADGHGAADYFLTRLAPYANSDHHCGEQMRSPETAWWRAGSVALRSYRGSLVGTGGAYKMDLLAGIERYPRTVLFLAGRCSLKLGPALQREQLRGFPSARLETIDDAGHMVVRDNPELAIALIRQHFRS